MPTLNLREFYDRYIAALNARDFDVMDKFIHDEVILNGKATTRSAIVDVQREEVASVPDLHWVLTNLIIDGDRLGAQLVNTGTSTKRFAGVEPTGKSFEVTEYAVYQVVDGRFKHMAAIHDAEEVERQLTLQRRDRRPQGSEANRGVRTASALLPTVYCVKCAKSERKGRQEWWTNGASMY